MTTNNRYVREVRELVEMARLALSDYIINDDAAESLDDVVVILSRLSLLDLGEEASG